MCVALPMLVGVWSMAGALRQLFYSYNHGVYTLHPALSGLCTSDVSKCSSFYAFIVIAKEMIVQEVQNQRLVNLLWQKRPTAHFHRHLKDHCFMLFSGGTGTFAISLCLVLKLTCT